MGIGALAALVLPPVISLALSGYKCYINRHRPDQPKTLTNMVLKYVSRLKSGATLAKKLAAANRGLEKEKKEKKPDNMSSTIRQCGFTLHNYTPAMVDKLQSYVDMGHATYIIFQSEVCPETKREHLQGFVQFSSPVTWRKLKNDIDESIHISRVDGSPEQNVAYCSKNDSHDGKIRFHAGELSKQGKRTDLSALIEAAYTGKSKKQLLLNPDTAAPAIRYSKGVDALVHAVGKQEKRHYPTVGVALTGVTLAGKSTVANTFPDVSHVQRHDSVMWFDSYREGSFTCVFDEFEGQPSLSKAMFKQCIDKWPYDVPNKGSHLTWSPHIFVMCSNHEPSEWYTDNFMNDDREGGRRLHVHVQALSRINGQPVCRFTKVKLPIPLGYETQLIKDHKSGDARLYLHNIICDQHDDDCDQTCQLEKIQLISTLTLFEQVIDITFKEKDGKSSLYVARPLHFY